MANDNDFDDFDDTWMLNLQEFLDTIEPRSHDAVSTKVLEDILLNLEATDANFHRYSFIQQIKDKLEFELGPCIDNAIEKHETASSEGILVADISENLIHSKEFAKTLDSIVESVNIAAENIADHLNSDTFDFSDIPKSGERDRHYLEESECSTVDGVDFMFMPPDRYKMLAKDIDPTKPAVTRLKGLSVLQQVPQTDLVASDAWKSTRRGLLNALDDDIEEVNIKALKFLSRLFICGSSHVVKEYFTLLVENLIEYFQDSTSHMIFIESGLDLGDRRNVLLIRKFCLLNHIQQELPSFWLRYSDKYIEEMAQYTLNLLSIVPTPISDTLGRNLMSPLHFISLIDPEATWFKRWMHGFYGRGYLIKALANHKRFLLLPVKSCMNFSEHILDSDNQSRGDNNEEYISFSGADMTYTYFLHSLSIVSSLLLYKDGRELFSFKLTSGISIDVKIIMLAFIDILKQCPVESLNITKSLFHPVFLIADVMRSFVNAGTETCHACFCDDDICSSLVDPIRDILKNPNNVNEPVVNVVAGILADIASCEIGRSQLLYSASLERSIMNETSAVHVVAKALTNILDSHSNLHLTANALSSLLFLCQQFYITSEGLIAMNKYNFGQKIYAILFEQKKKNKALLEELNHKEISTLDSFESTALHGILHEDVAYQHAVQFESELSDNLLSFAITPKGVQVLEKTGGLDECVSYMYDRYRSKQQVSRIERHGYGVLVNQIAATIPGIKALDNSGYVKGLLNEVWCHLEGFTNDYTKTVLSDIPEDLNHRVSKKLFISIIKLLSSFPAVVELFGKVLALPSANYKNSEEYESNVVLKGVPHFHDFMNHLVLIDSYSKWKRLVHPEQTHLFALNVLGSVVTCLDSMLYLQSNFHFQEILLILQAECQHESKVFMIDPCSVKRNQILVQVHLLGGSNERIVPPDSLTQAYTSPYPWTLFSSYPVPDMYAANTCNSAVGPIHGESQFKEYLEEIKNETLDAPLKRKDVIERIRKMYCSEVKSKTLKSNNELLPELLHVMADMYVSDSKYRVFTMREEEQKKPASKKSKLSEPDELAVDMVIRYGLLTKSFRSKVEALDAFRSLIQQTRNYFGQGSSLDDDYPGFDWFVSIIFLLFGPGNTSTWSFLKTFSCTLHSVYLWIARLTCDQRKNNNTEIHPIFSSTCHYVEIILQRELPQVYAAFRLSGYPPSQICQHWLRQCFLNYLDFSGIVWYICTCIIMGIDYQVYFILSILKHLQNEILLHTQNNDLVIFLKSTAIKRFRVHDYMEYMKKLETEYRAVLLEDLIDGATNLNIQCKSTEKNWQGKDLKCE